jgi:hypothetical protein
METNSVKVRGEGGIMEPCGQYGTLRSIWNPSFLPLNATAAET